jgi:hypothetical protein
VVSTQTVTELSFEPPGGLRSVATMNYTASSVQRGARGSGALGRGRSPSCPSKTAGSEIRPYLFDTEISR